jgi:hypothetical protein
MDSGASNHLTSDPGNLTVHFSTYAPSPSNIVVGIWLYPSHYLCWHHNHSCCSWSFHPLSFLITPPIIKNLIYVHRFRIDNNFSVENDPYSLSVKDLRTKNVIVRCNSFMISTRYCHHRRNPMPWSPAPIHSSTLVSATLSPRVSIASHA